MVAFLLSLFAYLICWGLPFKLVKLYDVWQMCGIDLLIKIVHTLVHGHCQVDLQGILSMVPLPLSQGVLLSLLQQLACDINKDTPRKLGWMTDVAVVINPGDPMIAMHVRPIFDQVYQILNHHRSLPTTTSSQGQSIRLLMHVINSMLMTCKWLSHPAPAAGWITWEVLM